MNAEAHSCLFSTTANNATDHRQYLLRIRTCKGVLLIARVKIFFELQLEIQTLTNELIPSKYSYIHVGIKALRQQTPTLLRRARS